MDGQEEVINTRVTLQFEVSYLSDAFELIRHLKKQSIRNVAEETKLDPSTTWRGLTHPTKASGITLMKLVAWAGLNLDDFEALFRNGEGKGEVSG